MTLNEAKQIAEEVEMPSNSPPLSAHHDKVMLQTLERIGYLPWCVLDGIGNLPGIEAGESCADLTYEEACDRWFKKTGKKNPGTGTRCAKCAFQGKPGTGAYPNCGVSWVHDKDSGCECFLERDSKFARDHSMAGDGYVPPPYWWELNHETYQLSGPFHRERERRFRQYLQDKRVLKSGQLELFRER